MNSKKPWDPGGERFDSYKKPENIKTGNVNIGNENIELLLLGSIISNIINSDNEYETMIWDIKNVLTSRKLYKPKK